MPKLSKLISALREAYPELPEERRDRGLKSFWRRPPLVPKKILMLGDVNVCDYIAPKVKLDASDARMVFEQFVDQYLVKGSRRRVKSWMAEKLDIPPRTADWLFPNDDREDTLQHHLAVLIWYLSHIEYSTSAIGLNTCALAVEGAVFGVRDNVVLSRFHEITLKPFDYWNSILHFEELNRGTRVSEDITLANFRYALSTIEDDEKREAASMALSILFFRYANFAELGQYLYDGFKVRVRMPRGYKKACQVCIEGMLEANPMVLIRKKLLGTFLTRDEFDDAFGPDAFSYAVKGPKYAVGFELCQKWYDALVALQKQHPTHKKEEIKHD